MLTSGCLRLPLRDRREYRALVTYFYQAVAVVSAGLVKGGTSAGIAPRDNLNAHLEMFEDQWGIQAAG